MQPCPRTADDTLPPDDAAYATTIPAPPPCPVDEVDAFVLRPLSFGLPPAPESLSAWDGFAADALDEDES